MRIHRHAANPEGDFPGEGLGGDGADLLGIVEIAGEGESSVLDRPGGTTDHGQLARETGEPSQLEGEFIVGDEENVRPLRLEPAVKGEGLELIAAMSEDGFHRAVDTVPGESGRGMIAAAPVMFPLHHEARPTVTGLLQPLDEAEYVLEMVDDDAIELRARDGKRGGDDGEFPPVEQVVEGSQIRHRQEQQSLHPAGAQHPHQAIARHLFRFDVDHVMRKARGPRALDRTGEQERDLLNVEDRELLESLGFDPSELGYSFTRDIVVESQDEETGASKRSYLGTLTVVERAFGDYWVPGSRLSVVRDARGELLELIGAWPEVDMDTDLRDADEPGTREEYASLLGVEAEAIIGLRAALEPTGVTEAHVVGARTVTYVTWRVPGPEGSTAAIGVYFEGATPLWSEE